MRELVRFLGYVWAAPTTLFGLFVAAIALLFRGNARLVDGVVEVHGSLIAFLLSRFVPIAGGAAAMTLGHVVLGRTRDCLDRTRVHERVHVRQCERWGPLFIPAYLGASLWAVVRGGHVYLDNWFERQAGAEVTTDLCDSE